MVRNDKFLEGAAESYQTLNNSYGDERYELGFNSRIGKLNFTFAPYYHRQYLTANGIIQNAGYQ